ncbi:hypothetical protein B2G69_10540 [Methylorubrum zatmanii]|nr:hypothetical protein B2G69_10540 [Methylorubrum zatmanii]
MRLSPSLYRNVMHYSCPSCGAVHEKNGKWFATVAKYICQGCGIPVFLTYQTKLQIFAMHTEAKARDGT